MRLSTATASTISRLMRTELTASADLSGSPALLFRPADAIRVRRSENRDTPLPPETPLGKNPPPGAVIDYFLRSDSSQPVSLEILDARGELVRRFSSDDKPGPL